MPAPSRTNGEGNSNQNATALKPAIRTARRSIFLGEVARKSSQATTTINAATAGLIPATNPLSQFACWKCWRTADTASIMAVGGRIAPSSAVRTPGMPPAAKPTNIASFNASLPGRTFENPTASTNWASVINSFVTASLYNKPIEAGPEGERMFTFRNIQSNLNQIVNFGVFMIRKGFRSGPR